MIFGRIIGSHNNIRGTLHYANNNRFAALAATPAPSVRYLIRFNKYRVSVECCSSMLLAYIEIPIHAIHMHKSISVPARRKYTRKSPYLRQLVLAAFTHDYCTIGEKFLQASLKQRPFFGRYFHKHRYILLTHRYIGRIVK